MYKWRIVYKAVCGNPIINDAFNKVGVHGERAEVSFVMHISINPSITHSCKTVSIFFYLTCTMMKKKTIPEIDK